MAINKDGIDTYWRVRLACKPAEVDSYSIAMEELFPSITSFEVEEDVLWHIDGFSEEEPDHQVVVNAIQVTAGLMEAVPPEMTAEELPHKDWVTENLQAFPPLHIGRFYIYGSHIKEKVPAGKLGLQVSAAGAFGSGEHSTTAGCLTAIDWLAKKKNFHHPLDMGCGTGILGMAAARVWGAKTIGVDIDERAVRIANENARLNGLANLFKAIVGNGYKDRRIKRRSKYDLIIANILARPLCSMAKDLRRHLAPKGWIILSGLLCKDANRVIEAHQRVGLKLVRCITIDGWATLLMKR